MPRWPAQVTQADIARAIRAMRAAGYPDVRVVFKDGSIIVEAAQKGESAEADDDPRYDQGELIIL